MRKEKLPMEGMSDEEKIEHLSNVMDKHISRVAPADSLPQFHHPTLISDPVMSAYLEDFRKENREQFAELRQLLYGLNQKASDSAKRKDQQEDNSLLPCPLCDCSMEILTRYNESDDECVYWAQCTRDMCIVRAKEEFIHRADAIENWNLDVSRQQMVKDAD